MNTLVLLIPIAMILTAAAIYLLIWAVANGQYDDLERDSQRILHDEDLIQKKPDVEDPSNE